jgi:hypothetical protein
MAPKEADRCHSAALKLKREVNHFERRKMMKSKKCWRTVIAISARPARSVTIVLLLGMLTIGNLGPAPVQAAQDPAVQRPISDFLDAQGTTMVFNSPVPDQVGWSNNPALPNFPPPRFGLFDYAGLANDFLISQGHSSLDTRTDGTITERPLADGRAEVSVILHTTNALTWASVLVPDPSTSPTLFGNRAADVLNGATPALGDSVLQVVFKNTAPGAPLPDLVNAFILGKALPGQELVFIAFLGTATGPLHALASLGPEGTPGLCLVVETGLLMKSFNLNSRPGKDAFPAELVELRRIGR